MSKIHVRNYHSTVYIVYICYIQYKYIYMGVCICITITILCYADEVYKDIYIVKFVHVLYIMYICGIV